MHVYIVENENYARDTVVEHLQGLGHRTSLHSGRRKCWKR